MAASFPFLDFNIGFDFFSEDDDFRRLGVVASEIGELNFTFAERVRGRSGVSDLEPSGRDRLNHFSFASATSSSFTILVFTYLTFLPFPISMTTASSLVLSRFAFWLVLVLLVEDGDRDFAVDLDST